MTAYSTLIGAKSTAGSIKSWINVSNIPVEQILTDAQNWIWLHLRVRENLLIWSGTISSGASSLDCPSDFMSAKLLRITGQYARRIERRTPEEVEEAQVFDTAGDMEEGTPTMFYVTNGVFQFDCAADQAYPARLLYYAALAPLATSTNENNVLTGRANHVLRSACLMQANIYMKDDAEKAYQEALAMRQIEDLNRQEDQAWGLIADSYVA